MIFLLQTLNPQTSVPPPLINRHLQTKRVHFKPDSDTMIVSVFNIGLWIFGSKKHLPDNYFIIPLLKKQI